MNLLFEETHHVDAAVSPRKMVFAEDSGFRVGSRSSPFDGGMDLSGYRAGLAGNRDWFGGPGSGFDHSTG